MKLLRPAAARGHASHGWLDSWHTFSFADYWDEAWLGFGALRVINDDTIAPGTGFGRHPHRDMEILTVVLEGSLEHRDSLGNGSVIRPGEVQRMTAGLGIEHSERNPSPTEKLHLLQIWISPSTKGLTPGYEQREFPPEGKSGRLRLVASPDGREGSLTIHQDARVYLALLESGQRADHALAPGRRAWVHVARGAALVNGTELRAGDGVGLTGESALDLDSPDRGELILFDLP